jgi:Rod binding domain-containing protein
MTMDIQPLSDSLMPLSSAAETRLIAPPGDLKNEQAAKDFESVLLHKLLQEMANTVDESPLLDEGAGQSVKDMFWYYLAQDLADKGGLGLWKQIAARQGYAGAEQGKKVNP